METTFPGTPYPAYTAPETPARATQETVLVRMDRKLLGYTPADVLSKQRAWAGGILGSLVFLLGIGWKRVNAPAAFWTLVVMQPLGFVSGSTRFM